MLNIFFKKCIKKFNLDKLFLSKKKGVSTWLTRNDYGCEGYVRWGGNEMISQTSISTTTSLSRGPVTRPMGRTNVAAVVSVKLKTWKRKKKRKYF